MIPKLRINISLLFIVFALSAMGQSASYRYRAKIKDITENWHSLKLPNWVFSRTKTNLEDFRIYGFKGTDTIEIPYILEKSADQIVEREFSFVTINQSHDVNGYYFTFQANSAVAINQLRLSFEQNNFDWKVSLEGSNNNNKWFNILTDQRIIAIKNAHTDYRFTQLDFPISKYKYFRIHIQANEEPKLNAVKILETDTIKGISQPITYRSFKQSNDPKAKESIAEIELATLTPLSDLLLVIRRDLDFYRPIKIEYATDSIQTDRGIQYQYVKLMEGTISSLQQPVFDFNGLLVKKIRVTIQNHDNEPLSINAVTLRASVYELIARFKDPTYHYWLYLGNADAQAPIYELKNFENKIPIGVTALNLEQLQQNPSYKVEDRQPFFKSNYWIWYLMGFIILLLGFFTVKMLRESK